MVKKFLPKNYSNLVESCRNKLGFTKAEMMRLMGIRHNQSWAYIEEGAKIQPQSVENILAALPPAQLIELQKEILAKNKKRK